MLEQNNAWKWFYGSFSSMTGEDLERKMYAAREARFNEGFDAEEQQVEPVASSDRFLYETTKRVVDIIGALLLILATSPILFATILIIWLSSSGPVIFRQNRLTKGGREFTLLKFRTMVQDAEAGTGAVWAIDADPRVTPFGRFLRKTRIDELPQLWNVLKGEMSLIGPRPERPEIARTLIQELPSFEKRLEVKAGITGLAQVGTGYASCLKSYRKKLALDLIYIQNRSLLLDLRIALKTVLVILTGTGAK